MDNYQTDSFFSFPKQQTGDEIYTIVEDSQKNIWIVTNDGLKKYQEENKRFASLLTPIDENYYLSSIL